jgi:hypothetical protein
MNMVVLMGTRTDGSYKEIAVNEDGELRIESDLSVTVGDGLSVDVATLPSLPAGDNNIGNVDVVSLPPITGVVTANPPAQAITRLRISISTSGDTVLIAAPEGALCIYYEMLKFQNNSDAAITALVKFGAGDTNYDPTFMKERGDGYIDAPPRGYVKLPPATALIINLDVTGKELIGHMRYWIAE